MITYTKTKGAVTVTGTVYDESKLATGARIGQKFYTHIVTELDGDVVDRKYMPGKLTTKELQEFVKRELASHPKWWEFWKRWRLL